MTNIERIFVLKDKLDSLKKKCLVDNNDPKSPDYLIGMSPYGDALYIINIIEDIFNDFYKNKDIIDQMSKDDIYSIEDEFLFAFTRVENCIKLLTENQSYSSLTTNSLKCSTGIYKEKISDLRGMLNKYKTNERVSE